MQVLTAYHTDIGIEKKTNQDSLCIQVAESPLGKIVMAVVCDGMGGLSKGELASASVIRAFKKWFDTELARQFTENAEEDIRHRWDRIIREQNQRIGAYGKSKRINLGTTLTALLIVENKFYLIGHIGDTRAYCITNRLEQLTKDHTVIQNEISKGRLTVEEAETDSRKNVLLQCIGESKTVDPDYINGKPEIGDVYMICTDGFRHLISPEEIYTAFKPSVINSESDMEQKAKELVELNKQRGEKDNITVVLIKI
jgi:serine/threonine protein phosphatase PrpC